MWTKWLFYFLASKGHFSSIEKKKKKIRRKVIFVQLMPRSNSCPKRNKGVCHTLALPFTLKINLKAKEEEIWKLKYFTIQKYT